MTTAEPACPVAKPVRAWLWRTLGTTCVGIGFINVFIPLMPTTVFLIMGVWAWSKGAPELKARLLQHPRYGTALRHWEQGGRISKRGKRMAACGMATGFAISTLLIGAKPATSIVGLCLLAVALWLWSRPEP